MRKEVIYMDRRKDKQRGKQGFRIKVQHFFTADGQYIKSLKYYANGVCSDCGKDVLRVRRHGKQYVLAADELKLLQPSCGLDSIYDKHGVRHMGRLVQYPQPTETYIAGYLPHECS